MFYLNNIVGRQRLGSTHSSINNKTVQGTLKFVLASALYQGTMQGKTWYTDLSKG